MTRLFHIGDQMSNCSTKCLQDFCNMNTPIFCVPSADPTCSSEPTCGYSWGTPGKQQPGCPVFLCVPNIYWPQCDRGIVGSPCNNTIELIFHEMIGVCGIQHQGSPDPIKDPCDRHSMCLCSALKLF
jgi:hypothetical protein